MTSEQQLQEAQKALQHLAEAVGWWIEYVGTLGEVYKADPGSRGKILRYPHLFEAMMKECPFKDATKTFIQGRGFTVEALQSKEQWHNTGKCHCMAGYIVRPVMEFWWRASGALVADGLDFELDLTNEVLQVEAYELATIGVHPALALIEALEQMLPKREAV